MARDRQKQNYKAGWLVNSPNNYVKQEMEETGTQNPKKFSKVCIHPISFRYQGCGYILIFCLSSDKLSKKKSYLSIQNHTFSVFFSVFFFIVHLKKMLAGCF